MISAVVLTKNEEKNIKQCLQSLLWCDEIIVIDDFSEDQTCEIAKEFGVEIFKHKLNQNFADQRNYGLKKAKGEWVLFVDSDEVVSNALRSEITNLKLTVRGEARQARQMLNTHKGFFVRRIDVLWGKELRHGEIGEVKLLRIARKGAGIWQRRVHEHWKIQGSVGTLRTPLLHYPHETLTEFLDQIDFYSTLHAEQKYADRERSNVLKILFWPLIKFFNNWLLRGGFLDGTRGFITAFMMSLHSFLAWSKLWLLQKKI